MAGKELQVGRDAFRAARPVTPDARDGLERPVPQVAEFCLVTMTLSLASFSVPCDCQASRASAITPPRSTGRSPRSSTPSATGQSPPRPVIAIAPIASTHSGRTYQRGRVADEPRISWRDLAARAVRIGLPSYPWSASWFRLWLTMCVTSSALCAIIITRPSGLRTGVLMTLQ